MVYDYGTLANVYLDDMSDTRGVYTVPSEPAGSRVAYNVSNSRGEEVKAVKAMTKALNNMELNMVLMGWHAANETSAIAQKQLMEFFIQFIRGLCEQADLGANERNKNFNTIAFAQQLRDGLRREGLWNSEWDLEQ